jgi:hypothetical protein
MAYTKILVDNPTCSRRFHISFDDSAAPKDHVKLSCPYCGVTIFEASQHPAVELSRQENLTKRTELTEIIVEECKMADTFGDRTIPQAAAAAKGPHKKDPHAKH